MSYSHFAGGSIEFDAWDGKSPSITFTVGTTSDVLKSVGVKDQEIKLHSGRVINKINKHPEITRNIFRQIPELLEHPVIVQFSDAIDPKTGKPKYDSNITVVGELYAKVMENGKLVNKPVLVSLELLPTNQRKTMVLDFVMITSAYKKDALQQYLKENSILYIDPNKKRTDNWLSLNRLQLPVGETNYDSIRKIAYVGDKVKVQNSKNMTAVEKALFDAGIIDEFGQKRNSDRDSDSVSNRSLLANALESVAQNEIERSKIQEYKEKVSGIEAQERKLSELNAQIKELSFAKGPRDMDKLRALRDEATKTANRINIYDKQLLRLEASKPLRDVLTREKKMAYKRAEQKGKDNSLFTKMKQFFDNLLTKIRNTYKGLTPDSDEGKAVLEMTVSIEKIQRLFADALVDASDNFQVAEKNTTQEGGVAMSIREVVGESGKNYGKGVCLDSVKLTNIPEDQRKATVIGLFRKLGGKKVIAYDQNGMAVEISIAKGSRRFKNTKGKRIPFNNHITSFLNNPIKQEALIWADELIAASRFEGQEKAVHAHDWLDNNGKNHWDNWKVFIQEKNDSVWEATLKVANTIDGEKVLYEIHPIEMVEAARKPGTSTTNNKVAQPETEVKKNSDRDYSYGALTGKQDMVVTTVGYTVPRNRADVVYQAKQNAAKVGKFNPKDGSVSVHVDDVDTDVILGTKGLEHGLRRISTSQTDPTWLITLKAGEIIKNAIKINEITPSKKEATETYVLIGAAKALDGEFYVVRFVVNQYSRELTSLDVLYAINAKKEDRLRSMRPGFQGPVTDPKISIADLLDIVNRHFPDILPEDVLKHYVYDARPEGDLGEDALYQDRADEAVSNRSLLANALEGVAQNEIERSKIQEYKEKISVIEAQERKLSELNAQIREISFAKGPRDMDKLRALRDEATKTANRINIYDKQLLRLEASKPLQDVLAREKKAAYKRAEQKGKEALEAYREKTIKSQQALVEKWQESRKKGIDSRHRTAMRHKINNVVNELNQYLLRGTKERHVPIELPMNELGDLHL